MVKKVKIESKMNKTIHLHIKMSYFYNKSAFFAQK